MKPEDLNYLRKLKLAGLDDLTIAQKLNLTEEQVRSCWKQISQIAEITSGYGDLVEYINQAALQYRSLGALFQILVKSVGNLMTPAEIRALVDPDPEKTVQNFLHCAMVLRPFNTQKAEDTLLESMFKN